MSSRKDETTRLGPGLLVREALAQRDPAPVTVPAEPPALRAAQPWTRWRGFGFTIAAVIFLEVLATTAEWSPNPPALLILGIVFAAFDGGITVGLASAIVSWLYVAYHYAVPNMDVVRLIAWAIAMPSAALLIGFLKERADRGAEALRRESALEARMAERMLADRELRENEEWFRRIVETAEEGIWVLDHTGRITYANSKIAALLGYRPETLVGRSLFDVIPAEDRDQARSLFARRKTGISERFDFRFERSDGSDLWMLVSASPIMNSDGRFAGSLGMLTDITERRRTEDDVRRTNEELERLVTLRTERLLTLERQRAEQEQLAAAGRMAARIAHEINNPLAGIKLSFTLVRQAIPPDYQHYSYVQRIDAEIERIRTIVHGMFDIYRPDQDQPRRFRIGDTALDVVAILDAGLKNRGVRIDISTQPEGADVEYPEGPIRQILYNLVQNAVDASPRDGIVEVDIAVRDAQLVISVRDRGPGIPESDAEKIYLPFFTTKKGLERSGLGLGLSVTRNLVDLFRGSITFVNRHGGGTAFRVELPLRREGEPPAA